MKKGETYRCPTCLNEYSSDDNPEICRAILTAKQAAFVVVIVHPVKTGKNIANAVEIHASDTMQKANNKLKQRLPKYPGAHYAIREIEIK